MNEKKTKPVKQGISLRKLNIGLFVIALLITIVMFVAMKQTSTLYNQTHEITQQADELRQSAYNMQLASDYLTEQIRCFVITGEKKYLDNYFEEANVTKRREKALETIEKYRANSNAYENINEAMMGSLELMNTEYYAALLTIDAYGYDRQEFSDIPGNIELASVDAALSTDEKRKLAERMLFDNRYRSKKEYISSNMQRCLSELTKTSGEEQKNLASRLNHQVYLEHVLTELLIAIMLGIVITTTILVINPLMKFVELIRDEKPIPLKGAYEVRFLAKTYNLIYYSNVESKKKLAYEASHDQLTGLFNRRGYELLMNNIEIESSALMLVDLDHFKEINDNNGHDVGDRVLIRMSESLLKAFKSYGYVCRLGGDEFAVILIHVDSSTKSMADKKIKKINEKLSKSAKGSPAFSISAGVAFGRHGMDETMLFKTADKALYEAKESGRKAIRFGNVG